jgi:hypothetical protein
MRAGANGSKISNVSLGRAAGESAHRSVTTRDDSGISALINRSSRKNRVGAVNMRRHSKGTKGVLTALRAGTAVLLWSAAAFASTPLLGPDCGATGASIMGSDSAGKVTLGAPPVGTSMPSTCTLAFSVPYTNPPACTAMNETNGGGFSVAVGVKTTQTTLELNSLSPWAVGDVISYICVEY